MCYQGRQTHSLSKTRETELCLKLLKCWGRWEMKVSVSFSNKEATDDLHNQYCWWRGRGAEGRLAKGNKCRWQLLREISLWRGAERARRPRRRTWRKWRHAFFFFFFWDGYTVTYLKAREGWEGSEREGRMKDGRRESKVRVLEGVRWGGNPSHTQGWTVDSPPPTSMT